MTRQMRRRFSPEYKEQAIRYAPSASPFPQPWLAYIASQIRVRGTPCRTRASRAFRVYMIAIKIVD